MKDRGITLIEVMVAVLVLSLGTVAAFRVLDTSRMSIVSAPERLFAQQVALNRIAAYQALGLEAARGLDDTSHFAGHTWHIDVSEAKTVAGFVELRVRASIPEGAGSLLVAFVRPNQADEAVQ